MDISKGVLKTLFIGIHPPFYLAIVGKYMADTLFLTVANPISVPA
jgi:hypothetical protein